MEVQGKLEFLAGKILNGGGIYPPGGVRERGKPVNAARQAKPPYMEYTQLDRLTLQVLDMLDITLGLTR